MNTCKSFRRGVVCLAQTTHRFILPLGFAWIALPCSGAPSPDPLTGHYYDEVTTVKTWDQARVDAALLTFGGKPGHLATISTLRENLIVQYLGGTAERWIGLTDSTAMSTLDGFNLSTLGTSEQGNTSALSLPPQGTPPTLGERGFGFRWITGEPYDWMNWRNGTPSGPDGVYMITQGVWQDAAAGSTVGEAGPVTRKSTVEFDVELNQERFRLSERKAAASFNGNGNVPNLVEADRLFALSTSHPDVAAVATNRAYVVSFQDPDLGGGLPEFVRAPILLNGPGTNENDIVIRASAQVVIPQAGEWTFGVASGDTFRLRVGDNEFVGAGVLPSAPPKLTRTGQGTLAAAPGGSGETFYFPQAGTYDFFLTTLDSGFYAFVQLFAAPGNLTNYSAVEFDLVGDQLNGGLALACLPRVPGTLGLTVNVSTNGVARVSWNSRPCATYRLDFSEDLSAWETLVDGIHPASALTSVDHAPGTQNGFYRLVEMD